MNKFKLGDWVYWSGQGPTVAKIAGTPNNNPYNQCYHLTCTFKDEQRGIKAYDSCHENNLRLATKEEIIDHLTEQIKKL
jgi:hypothetical protein